MTLRPKPVTLKNTAFTLLVCWTVVILASEVWNVDQHKKEVGVIVRQIGRSSIERDKLYRLWNTMYGGVYVPVTEKTKPNPYLTLEMAPHRDLIVSPDLTLTLINPAYMTRQVYELARDRHAVSGHITSVTPLNPANKADAWEEKALRAVAQGLPEYSETVRTDGAETIRMLLPLRTESACLQCHASQGYKVGDLRGGISVSMPLASVHGSHNLNHRAVIVGHLVIWVIGVLGIFGGYTALARGETARRSAEKQILRLAHFDRLTGLVNRNLFHDRMAQALTLARRQARKVALLYIDLDRFKPINDTFGHEVGDLVLQEVAGRLSASVRKSDTVARIGGDEFIVVLQGLQDKQEAVPSAQKIINAMLRPFVAAGREHLLGASVGISCFPDDGVDMDTLIKKADDAMYHVKNQGGGCFRFF